MTSKYSCGCQPPTYCPTHEPWACHSYPIEPFRSLGHNPVLEECPPCRNARWRSVTLDARATPTRGRSK